MKLLLVFVAILGIARSDMDDLTAAKLFIKCLDKALYEGLPSFSIPSHNPLIISDFSYYAPGLLTKFGLSFTNSVLYNLLDYNFTKLEAISYTDPARVAYDYDLYWPKLNFTGDFEIDFEMPLFREDIVGSINVVLSEIDFTGIFNLTKPGQEAQGIPEHLDDFTLVSKVEDVSVTVTIDGNESPEAVEEALKLTIWSMMNNFPATVGEYIKEQRFNDFWIGHPERITAILENCIA